MSETAIFGETDRRQITDPISRRSLLAGSAGLVGAAAAVSGGAFAQQAAAPVPPAMPAVQAPVRQDWLDKRHEAIIEPELPIVDPHHHLWDRPNYRYLFPDLLADVGSGHNIRATCYEQAREMYRADGPEELKSLGEAEFVSGVSAMSASGKYGPTRCIAGIIGFADLRLGSRVKGVLERHIAVSDGRLRGIRNGSTWSDDPTLKTFTAGGPRELLLDKSFREGMCRPRSAGTCLRRMDVPDAARRSCRSGGRIPADDNRSQSLRRTARHRPLCREARGGLHRVAQWDP